MTKQPQYLKTIAAMAPIARFEQAKTIIHALTVHAVDLVHLHESNQVLVRSNQVTEKVRDGRATHALDVTRIACARYEVIRLLAMWDAVEEDAMSIPMAIALLDDERVVQLVHITTYEAYAAVEPRLLNPEDDPALQEAVRWAVRASQKTFAQQQAERAEAALRQAITAAKEHIASGIMTAVTNLRHHLAHALARTRAERGGYERSLIAAQDVAALLWSSVALVEEMYCWVNGTSFDICGDVRDQAKRYAACLWENISHVSEVGDEA